MSADTVCRVCLRSDMTLYNVQNDLQNIYERIAREKYNKVGYPVHMCYICLTVLRKCQRFMKTAQDTNIVLQQWYNQQNEIRGARPLYTYSLSKVEFITTNSENMTLQVDVKVEEVKSELTTVQQAFPECNTDVNIEETDTDGQTDYSEFFSADTDTVEDNNDRQTEPLFVDREDYKVETRIKLITPHDNAFPECNTDVNIEETDTDGQTDYSELFVNSDSADTNTVEDNNDGQTEPLFVDGEDYKELALNSNANIETRIKLITPHDNDALPIMKCKASNTKPQRQAPETSGETVSNEITSLNSTPSQPYNLRHRNTNTKPTFRKNNRNSGEIGKLGKIVKTNAIRYKNKRLARSTIKNIKKSNKLSLSPSVLEKNEINTCNYKTTVQQHITRQITGRTDEKRFECDICNYKGIRKGDLVQHIRIHYEKQFSCNTCNHKCRQKNALKRHMRTHTGEKPFICDICDYKFIDKGSLVSHMKSHTCEKPFECNTCNHKCRDKNALKRHMRTHTGEKPFTCDVCDCKFTEKRNLRDHMRTHTGEKPFACNTCYYKSVQKSTLVRHMRTHTGEKPFHCNICDYKFSLRHHLKSHLLYKHLNKKRK